MGRERGRCTHLVVVGQAAPVVPQVFARRDVRRDHAVKVAGEDDAPGPRSRLRLLPLTSLQHIEDKHFNSTVSKGTFTPSEKNRKKTKNINVNCRFPFRFSSVLNRVCCGQ